MHCTHHLCCWPEQISVRSQFGMIYLLHVRLCLLIALCKDINLSTGTHNQMFSKYLHPRKVPGQHHKQRYAKGPDVMRRVRRKPSLNTNKLLHECSRRREPHTMKSMWTMAITLRRLNNDGYKYYYYCTWCNNHTLALMISGAIYGPVPLPCATTWSW